MELILEGIIQAFRLMAGGDREVWRITLLSLQVSGAATFLSLCLGIPLGAFLALTRFPGRNLVVSLVNTGMGLPPVVVGLFISIMLWRSGPLGFLKLMYTPTAMVVAQVVIAFPIVAGLTMVAFQTLNPNLRLQLLGIGASRPQLLWLLCKEARLPLLAAVMAGFGGVISEVGSVMMVGGNIKGQTRVLTTATVLETQMGNFGTAIAFGFDPPSPELQSQFRSHAYSTTGADPMAQALLALQGLSVRYGEASILNIPALAVQTGEVLAIIGPNGAGKSTLLRVMGLLEQPAEGKIYFQGQEAAPRNTLALRRRMASVFQEPLLLNASVYENAAMGFTLRGLDRHSMERRVRPWLERLGIAHLVRQPARSLSGGEAQRTSLVRALALDPELLLLDEPFSALDPPTREGLLLDLETILREEGITTVFVTHDRNEAFMLGDRVAILMGGELL